MGVQLIRVCDVCSIFRSNRRVIVELADHRYSGSEDDLMVTVSKFTPRVVCSRRPFPRDASVLEACQAIVDKMETSKDTLIFAQKDIYTRLETPIPFYYLSPSESGTVPQYNP